jgi:hypothetical protein
MRSPQAALRINNKGFCRGILVYAYILMDYIFVLRPFSVAAPICPPSRPVLRSTAEGGSSLRRAKEGRGLLRSAAIALERRRLRRMNLPSFVCRPSSFRRGNGLRTRVGQGILTFQFWLFVLRFNPDFSRPQRAQRTQRGK